jgi:hypothetical protein
MHMKIRSFGHAACVALGLALSACGGDYSRILPEANVAPVASAGGAQNVLVGTQVALDASHSTDANADPLTYAWTVTSKPMGSAMDLSSATAVKPTFAVDAAGVYVFSLVVSDGKVYSRAATVTITAASANVAPVANPGSAQSVVTGAPVSLDGSASSDANGDTLSYAWTLAVPAGSTATLTGATGATPQFTPDVAGDYVASLVVDDGRLSSAAATVTVTAALANVAPVANAGSARNVPTAAAVTLDGSASSDANGDALTYVWSFTAVPTGSAAAFVVDNIAQPTFTPDVSGLYVAQLIVNDGHVSSAPVTVNITAANVAPVANAGSAQSVARGVAVVLDGSASSDADHDAITYAWSFVSVPSGSAAALSAANVVNPGFTPDVSGSYVVRLIVNDGQLASAASTVTITATPITATAELVVDGSFESGLAAWSQGTSAETGASGTCGYNGATAPGTETITGFSGFAATDGTQVALGSIASTGSSGRFNCVLYQDVTIPAGTTSLTLGYDVAVSNGNDGCYQVGAFVGLYPTSAVPGLLSTTAGSGNRSGCITSAGPTLVHGSMVFNAGTLGGSTVRLAFINVAIGAGHEVIGIDNVHLVAISTH